MLFASLEFILIFLPLGLGFFLLARVTHSLGIVIGTLIVMSLALYCYSEPQFVPIMLASVVVNYLVSLGLRRHAERPLALWLFSLGVLLNLAPFLYFKYAGSLANSTPNALAEWVASTLPLGISFFTFQQIAFLLDVRRGAVRDVTFGKYCLFVLFFPHLVAGPIVRQNELLDQFSRESFLQNLSGCWAPALTLFSIGLLKKVLVADRLAPYVEGALDEVMAGHAPTIIEAWTMLLAAAARIYYDYSAYADMALALALCFGIHLPISFYSPYRATSVADFWRRWNITLMRFFRDHVYIPLGGNRHGRLRQCLAISATMIACGIWHGASGNYLVWGALVAACIILELVLRPVTARIPLIVRTLLSRPVVLLAYVLPLAFFLFPTVDQARSSLAGAFGLNGLALPGWALASEQLAPAASMPSRFQLLLLALAWAGIYAMPNTYQIFQDVLKSRWTDPGVRFATQDSSWTAVTWRPSFRWAALTVMCLTLGVSSLGSDAPAAFYYFRF